MNLRSMLPVRRARAVVLLAGLVTLASCARESGGIRGSGTIEMDEVDVSSQIGGRIVRLAVNEGDSVRAGDTLAVLDRGEIAAEFAAQAARAQSAQAQYRDLSSGARPAEVLAARAELAAAEAEKKLAEQNYDRNEKLAAEQVVSQADLDRSRATRTTARARATAASQQLRLIEQGFRRQQVAAARDAATAATAQLAGARSRASELLLLAPVSGVVLLKNFEAGEVASPGLPVVTLGHPDSLWMRVYVGAPKMGAVRLGAAAQVRSRGVPGRVFHGRVVEIATRAEFTPRAALTEEEQDNLVFGVKIKLDPTGGVLKPGLPATATIEAR